MGSGSIISQGVAGMALPSSMTADGQRTGNRTTGYGDAFSFQIGHPQTNLAAEGSYFGATNATWGTAIACPVTASFAATTALLCIQNTNAVGGPTVFLHYISLFMTVVPASGTAWDIGITLDPNTRAPTGGTALIANNHGSGSTTGSLAVVTAGPTSIAAAVAARQIARRRIFNAIPVVSNQLLLTFASEGGINGQTMNGATALQLAHTLPPLAIAPGHTALLHSWYPSNAATGPSFEFDLGWWER